MNAKKCDRCGRFYEEYGDYLADGKNYDIEKSSMIRVGTETITGKFICENHFDLCPKCMSELNEFLGYEKPEKQETPWQYFWRKIGEANNDREEHEERTNEQV